MERLFAADGLLKPDLVLEDLFLGFGDREEANKPELFQGNSDLRIRDKHFPNLTSSAYRRCITFDHSQRKLGNRVTDNQGSSNANYYNELVSTGPTSWDEKHRFLLKPCSGVFDLWKNSRLSDQVENDYQWLPDVSQSSRPNRHIVRERLPMIINQLVNRAETIMRDEPSSVAVCLYGAVLANEASDLLGGRVPTTGLRATALKHEFEVMAECDFFGAAYHLDVQSRLSDIHKSIEKVAPWFSSKNGPQSLSNIRAGIVNRLLIRFRENNQFDEEQACLHEIRCLHREITLADCGLFKRRAFGLPSRYALYLLSSMERFFMMMVIWGLTFWAGFAVLVWDWEWSAVPDWPKVGSVLGESLEHCFNSFLGFSTISAWKESVCPPMFLLLSCIAVAWGIFHLGIFVAHIYSYIARK